MAAAAESTFSFSSNQITVWKLLLKNYNKVFKQFCEKKSKKTLHDLDDWFQNSLGKQIKDRNPSHLIKSDLIKLMEWKLTRGKFRPRLTQMIAENSDDLIKDVSVKSFNNITNAKLAIESLCKLKAVGPATASAILTSYCPEKYSFMADEAVSMVLSGKIDYTLKYYLAYLKEVQGKAKELSKTDTDIWTPHQVELALWTYKISQQLKIALDENQDANKIGNGKRKSDTLKDENETKQKKKQKT